MHKIKLHAILIKQSEYGDTSLIYRFFTCENGLIGVLAKGIRKKNDPLIPLCCYELFAYEPKEPGLWLFSEAAVDKDLSQYPSTSTWAAAECGMELISQMLFAQEDLSNVYHLSISFLEYLQKTPYNAILILWRFMLRITVLSGIGNPFTGCCMCNKSLATYPAYLVSKGGMLCSNCSSELVQSDDLIRLSDLSIKLIAMLPEIGNYLNEITLSPQTVQEINGIFEHYWLSHHKHPLKLKSLGLLSQFAF